MDREHHLVVYGATGYTGRLITEYLQRAPELQDVRWGIAGRDLAKLEAVYKGMGCPDNVRVFVAEASDSLALDRITRETRVVLSAVGPYSLLGNKLLESCLHNETHYCDISSEMPWARSATQLFASSFEAEGICAVLMAGFKSAPADLACHALRQHAAANGQLITSVEAFVTTPAHMSGGSLLTLRHLVENHCCELRRGAFNEKFLCIRPRASENQTLPPPHAPSSFSLIESSCYGLWYSRQFKSWTTPWFGGTNSSKVIRRSCFLEGGRHSHSYREQRLHASLTSAVISLAFMGMEPGYQGTAVLAAEMALMLAFEKNGKFPKPGFQTPATAGGAELVQRLRSAGESKLFHIELQADS
eukprot:gene15035-22949_t